MFGGRDMYQQAGNNMNIVRRIGRYFALEKGKSMVASCLIGLMILMWVRVFAKKHSPGTAEAALTAQAESSSGRGRNEVKIRFIKLPEIKGRNDVLSRDFFAVEGWENLIKDADVNNTNKVEEVNVIVEDDSEQGRRRKAVLRLARQLKLDVIALGKRPEAFIENTLVSVGDKLQVEDKGRLYEFDVIEIGENEVVLTCQGVRLEIKMLQEPGLLNAK